jgi:hypothetical protein
MIIEAPSSRRARPKDVGGAERVGEERTMPIRNEEE